MKGWQFTGTNEPLQLIEKEDPKATAGTVIIDVKAAGLCHSDVGTLNDPGWMDILAKVPIILGHEIAGVVSEVADDVTDFKVGDRVAVCPVGKDGLGPGNGRDGGYADKVLVPAVDLVRIPDNVSFEQAAASTDAGMTSFHALFNKGGAKAGMKVGVIGVGGLGQMAAKAAVVKGIDVYAADVSEDARQIAKDIGCKAVGEDIKEFSDVGLDLIVDYAGYGQTTSDAIDVVGVGGTVVLVGMGKLETTVNTSNLILKSVQLKGSVGGTVEDIEDVLEMMSEGHLDPVLSYITFEEIADGLKKLERHEVKGRLVAQIDN